MDTTTVNFAIEKLSDAFQHIKPGAVELGSDYVGYTVLKIMATYVWALVLLVVFSVTAFFRFKTALAIVAEAGDRYKNDEENLHYVIAWVSVVISFVAALEIFFEFTTVIVAYNYPLMYTLEQLIK